MAAPASKGGSSSSPCRTATARSSEPMHLCSTPFSPQIEAAAPQGALLDRRAVVILDHAAVCGETSEGEIGVEPGGPIVVANVDQVVRPCIERIYELPGFDWGRIRDRLIKPGDEAAGPARIRLYGAGYEVAFEEFASAAVGSG